MLISSLIFTSLLWDSGSANMPPSNCSCEEFFSPIYPPEIMGPWTVVLHTDCLRPPNPDCLTAYFGRRVTFNAVFRMDFSASYMNGVEETEDTGEYKSNLIMRASISGDGCSHPFEITLPGGGSTFPPNLMITHIDEENGCMAAWSCLEMQGASQKCAWIMCKSSIDVKMEVVNNLKVSISEKADIDPSYFVATKFEECEK